MATLILTPTEVISQIQQLLGDRYRLDEGALAVLKEIVQNADDAGATTLDLVVLDYGFSAARNSLLHGPALACINDGAFTREHERAIRTMAGTSKAEDAGSVGRFGVGQKSVFHLAEAYFYLGRSPAQPEVLADVIDPWADPERGDRAHPDWNQFEQDDRDLLQRALARWTTSQAWFVLYLPLRRESHQRPRGGVIASYFPDPAALAADLARMCELACVLPQLRGLRSIRAWQGADAEEPLGECVGPGPEGALSRAGAGAIEQRPFRGAIEVQGAKVVGVQLQCFGWERFADHPHLRMLMGSRYWPQRKVRRDDEIEEVAEKALPHGAVTVIREPVAGGHGDLRIAWAVFLPLSYAAEEPIPIGGAVRWRLVLHGYFFPDSGRRSVLGLEDAATEVEPTREQEVRQHWNAWIRSAATLPCLLPALAEALDATSPEDGEALCAALARTSLWSRHRAVIASEQALVWGPASGATACRRVPRSSRSLALPRVPPHAGPSVGRVLESLLRVEAGRPAIVGWDDGPRLAAGPRWDPWSDEDVAVALGAGLEEALLDELAVRYLAKCLLVIGVGAARGSHVVELLRRCVSRGLIREAAREAWQALIEHAPQSRILWLRGSVGLVRDVAAVTQHLLVLPIEARPGGWDAPRRLEITESDSVRLLEFLAPRIAAGARDESAERLAAEVVAAYGPRRVRDDPRLRDLPVFRVWSARNGMGCLSAAVLIQLSERRLVFRGGGMERPQEVARTVLTALRDESIDVILAADDVAESLGFGDLSLVTIAELLGGGEFEIASDPARRRRALELLLDGRSSPGVEASDAGRQRSVRRALRVLLHGEHRRSRDEGALYVLERTGDDALAAVARSLCATLEIEWRLLPETLAAMLPWARMQDLGIERVDGRWLVRLLGEHRGETVERFVLGLGDGERVWLRHAVVVERDEALWRTLPIHPIRRGGYASLAGERLYRASPGWAVPPRLADDVDLVQPDTRPEVEAWVERTVSPWSPAAQIEVCLGRRADGCAIEVLDALDTFRQRGQLPGASLASLQGRAWVPTAARGRVAPGEILDLNERIQVAARDLLGSGELVFVVPDELADEVRAHPAFRYLIEHGALRGRDALNALALQIHERRERDRECGRYVLPRDHAGLAAGNLLELGARSTALRGDRSWALFGALRATHEGAWLDDGRDLVEALTGDLDAPRLVALLELLSREPPRTDTSDDAVLFDHYLRLAVARPDFAANVLPRIRLLSAAGTWQPSSGLARWGANLRPSYQVHARHAAILRLSNGEGATAAARSASALKSSLTRDDLARAVGVLEAYLEPWRGRVGDEALGLFVCLFGSGLDGQCFGLAERYLAGRADDALDNVLLKYTTAGAAGRLGAERKTAFAAPFAFQTVAGGELLEVESLAGTTFQAAVDVVATDTVFVGQVPVASRGGWIRLRKVDPAAWTPEHLYRILHQSIEQLLEQALGLYLLTSAFDEFWSRFVVAEQGQVEVVRQLLLDSLPSTIAQLALRHEPLLREPLNRIERARMHDHEVRSGGRWDQLVRDAAQELEQARADLVVRIENEPAVQSSLLQAIRKRLAAYQYQPSQVLFELFQNADDAAAQLAEMLPPAGSLDAPARLGLERSRCFRVEATESGRALLRITHWGRAINQHHVGAGFRLGRERGYDLDLRNMLALHYSEKDEGATGRFGLGFKSVFLLTDSPRVTSRDVAFEVVAGILPVHRAAGRAAHGADVIGAASTFELPLRPGVEASQARERFERIGGLLPVFARAIRHVEVAVRDVVASDWTPESLAGVASAETGKMRLDLRGGDAERRLLVVRAPGPGPCLAIAFALHANGLADLPNHVPTVWCTTPTLEEWHVGFCMNGPFAVDVGRGQLARKADENLRVIADLGRLLGFALCALFSRLEEDLPATAGALGLALGGRTAEQTRQVFWSGVFDRLTRGFGALVSPDVREYFAQLHGPGRGLAKLLERCPALPTGLPGTHETLTARDLVRWVADEYLSRADVWAEVQRWPRVEGRMTPGSAIADLVQARLHGFGNAVSAQRVGLETVVGWAVPEGHVLDATDAAAIASVDRLLERDAVPAGTRAALAAWKKKLLFRSQRGDGQEARLLHLSEDFKAEVDGLEADRRADLQDELLRAQFAPPERVLSSTYAGNPEALRFVLFVRQRLHSEAPQLAEWACRATTQPAQRAVLQYLARGRLAREMAQAIGKAGGLPWCQEPAALRALATEAGLRDASSQLFALLFPNHETWHDWWETLSEGDEAGGAAGFGVAPVDPGEVLRRIAAWWQDHGRVWSKRYEGRVYPDDLQPPALARALRGEDGATPGRNAWLALLTLGACQRLGRQTPEQHRGFVERLRQSGSPRWWDVIVSDRSQPADWMTILDQWMAAQVQDETHGLWLGLFPTLYQFHRFAAVYRHLFLSAPERKAQFDLAQLLAPRADASLHGAGGALDAPPARRALGLGGVWVLRELVRLGVIAGPHLEPFCFVPRRRTRELLLRLGIDQPLHDLEPWDCSRAIHAFVLEHLDPTRAAFAGAFDLPLYLVMEDVDARRESGVEDLLR